MQNTKIYLFTYYSVTDDPFIYRLKYTISTDRFILAIKKWHGLVEI